MHQSVYEMMNFWIDKGTNDFRLDVIDLVDKIPGEKITANGPHLHRYLQEMNAATFGDKELLTVGEAQGATPEIAEMYPSPGRHELSVIFQFGHMSLNQQPGKEKWDLQPMGIAKLKQVFTRWQTESRNDDRNSLFWNNHDLPRMILRWRDDQEYWLESSKLFAILLHMMKDTPYIYQKEGIGVTNTPITDIREARDIETISMHHEYLEKGYSREEILLKISTKSHDSARRPIQWTAEKNTGFTTGTPWIDVDPNYQTISVTIVLTDKNSLFYTYQEMIRLRKEYPLIVWSDFKLLETVDEVISFYRTYGEERWLVVADFSDKVQSFSVDIHVEQVMIEGIPTDVITLADYSLAPWRALVVKMNQ